MAIKTFYYLIPFCSLLSAQLIITEIMYDLPGKDSPNEFIELLNISIDTVDLTLYEIRDIYARDQLISYNGLPVKPGGYGIILEGDHDPEKGIYSSFLANAAGVYLVDDLSIGNGLSAADSLFLINSSGEIVDSIGWDLALDPGYSYERILYGDDYGVSIWSASIDSLGTPGRINSNTPLPMSGKILSIETIGKTIHDQNELIPFSVEVLNNGIDQIEGIVFARENGQIIAESQPFIITSRDTGTVSVILDSLKPGLHTINFIFSPSVDFNKIYHSMSFVTGVRYRRGSIKISEFLSQQGLHEFEFIEVVNCSNNAIDMSGWTFSDKRTESPSDYNHRLLFPGSFFIFCSDSSILSIVLDSSLARIIPNGFPSLNNSGDGIIILDPFDTVIDSIEYDQTWPLAPGISTERVLPCGPSPWELSTAGSGMTPGFYNSVSPRHVDGKIDTGSFIIMPFNPDENRSFNICVNVVNAGEGPFEGIFSCTINDYHTLETRISIQEYLDTLFVCFSYPGMEAGFADIEMLLDIEGDTILNNELKEQMLISFPTGAVKINEFLPCPDDGQPEFIEITSEREINLKGWCFRDGSGTSIYLPELHLDRENYLVIAQDSSILPFLDDPSGVIISNSRWPSLNNSEDELSIMDPGGSLIEVVAYDSSWNFTNGRSQERISSRLSSSMFSSWRASVDPAGSTPGRPNSVNLPDAPETGYSVEFPKEIFSPDNDGHDDQIQVNYYTPHPSTVMSIMVFNLEGVLVWDQMRTYMPGKGIVSWDGFDNNGEELPIGIYLFKIVLGDPDGNNSYETVRSIVLARRL